ncbi:MAG: putative inorganic carbon transporter subunit DabA [Bryobacteraceae bacterium]
MEHAAHLLPAQGPIGVFIHHNTLHAFQHLRFEDAVCEAAKVYGTEPFLREQVYRDHIKAKRIQGRDLEALLDRETTEVILPGRLDRRALRKKLLIAGQRRFEPATIQWQLEETDLLQALRSDADPSLAARLRIGGAAGEAARLRELFVTCQGMIEKSQPAQELISRPSAALLRETGIDVDEVIHPLLIRLCGAFLDQGMAYWPMPNRQQGFLFCVRALLSQGWAIFPEYLERLGSEFRHQSNAEVDSVGVVISMLDRFGVSEADWDRTIQAELLALPGWAGMMHRLEQEPELAPRERLPSSLMDYLAVRLTLGAVAAASIGGGSRLGQRPTAKSPASSAGGHLAQAARLFDAFQILGIASADITSLDVILRQRLVDEIQSFDDLERRRLHLAYELRHELDVPATGEQPQDTSAGAVDYASVGPGFSASMSARSRCAGIWKGLLPASKRIVRLDSSVWPWTTQASTMRMGCHSAL